jgi:manganese/zinc/iron transport system substrate-binding protein
MKNKSFIGQLILIMGVFITLLFISGCDSSKKEGISVVSTTGIINDVVKNIGGDHINAIGLMGPGVDPHLYKATEGDVRRLAQADLICYNGLHLEAKMGDVLEQMSRRTKVLTVTQSFPRERLTQPAEFEGLYDPHVWFDVDLWSVIVDDIAFELSVIDPVHKEDYSRNATSYKEKLNALHIWVQNEVKQIPEEKRIIVTAHDAFGYFGKAYGFTVKGLQGISTESEAGAKDVIELASYIADKELKAIFIESSISERNVKAVQAAVAANGWDVSIGGELFSDALGDEGSLEGTYLGMIEHNVHTLVSALK